MKDEKKEIKLINTLLYIKWILNIFFYLQKSRQNTKEKL